MHTIRLGFDLKSIAIRPEIATNRRARQDCIPKLSRFCCFVWSKMMNE